MRRDEQDDVDPRDLEAAEAIAEQRSVTLDEASEILLRQLPPERRRGWRHRVRVAATAILDWLP